MAKYVFRLKDGPLPFVKRARRSLCYKERLWVGLVIRHIAAADLFAS